MGSTSVRISQETREALRALAAESQSSMREVLERAIECYRRQRLLEQANEAYAALRADPKAWQQELQERQAWDATLADGLAPE